MDKGQSGALAERRKTVFPPAYYVAKSRRAGLYERKGHGPAPYILVPMEVIKCFDFPFLITPAAAFSFSG